MLPLALDVNSRSIISSRSRQSTRDSDEKEKDDEARLYAKLTSRSQNHTKYFKNNRVEKLLMDAGNSNYSINKLYEILLYEIFK